MKKEEALAKINELAKEKNTRIETLETELHHERISSETKDREIEKLLEESQRYLKQLEGFQKLKEALAVLIPSTTISNSGSVSDSQIESSLRRILGINSGDVTLEVVKRRLIVEHVSKELPKIDTTKPEGKILKLVAQKKLEEPRPISVIQELAHLSRIATANICESLADQELLLETKLSDNRKAYQRHPDLEVELKS